MHPLARMKTYIIIFFPSHLHVPEIRIGRLVESKKRCAFVRAAYFSVLMKYSSMVIIQQKRTGHFLAIVDFSLN